MNLPNEIALDLKKVSVRYHHSFEPAILEVSFTAYRGTITSIIGPNGSGKTTLIKAILGLIPYEGEINLPALEKKRCGHPVGYVPQTHSIDLSFPMTVKEFLEFSHVNCPGFKLKSNSFKYTLSLLGAGALIDKPLQNLSGGQLQRILLARAILHRPALLILDEPETGIDIGGEQSLYDLLVKLSREKGMTVLVSSHEIDVVKHYADRVVCLNRSVVCEGKPEEVLNIGTLHKLYGRQVEDIYGGGHHHD